MANMQERGLNIEKRINDPDFELLITPLRSCERKAISADRPAAHALLIVRYANSIIDNNNQWIDDFYSYSVELFAPRPARKCHNRCHSKKSLPQREEEAPGGLPASLDDSGRAVTGSIALPAR